MSGRRRGEYGRRKKGGSAGGRFLVLSPPLALDPRNPHTAYAASPGPGWGDGAERGVFKTTDGGKSWQKVLYIDQKTGAADLAMDPQNPDKLFAAMWEYRRWPWFFKSGGPGSGLYCTVDGGKNWKKLNQGDFPVKG